MQDGEISKHADILQGVAQGCTLPPHLFKAYIHDLQIAVEAAEQRVTVGEDTMSRSMFTEDFVKISETPEGLQNLIEKARVH